MKEHMLLLILLFSWALASCRPLEPSLETAISVATSTLQATQPNNPTATATFTLRQAETLTPTQVSPMPHPTSTIVGTVIAVSDSKIQSSHRSPNGNWQAEVVTYECVHVGEVDAFAFDQLNFIQVADESTLVVDSQLQSCGGVGAFGLDGLFWAQNSRYFYYTNARESFPDGLCGYWTPPFIRIEVSNPVPEFLGIGNLSPDGSKLATWQDLELVVWDVDGGEVARTPAFAPDIDIGPIVWSPDSQSLVYLQIESYCPVSGLSYLVRLDLPETRQSLLLESEAPTFGNASWDDPEVLNLSDENGEDWRYIFSTKELQQLP